MSKIIEKYAVSLSQIRAIFIVPIFIAFVLCIYFGAHLGDEIMSGSFVLLGIAGAVYIWIAWPHSAVLTKGNLNQGSIFYYMYIVHILIVGALLVEGCDKLLGNEEPGDGQDFALLLILGSWITSAFYHARLDVNGGRIIGFWKFLLAIYFFPVGAFFLRKKTDGNALSS